MGRARLVCAINRLVRRLVGRLVDGLVGRWFRGVRQRMEGGLGAVGGLVVCLSLVSHLGVISVVISHVVDDLDAAVGQVDLVGALGGVAVALLPVAEVGARVVVGDGVTEGVRRGLLGAAARKRSCRRGR